MQIKVVTQSFTLRTISLVGTALGYSIGLMAIHGHSNQFQEELKIDNKFRMSAELSYLRGIPTQWLLPALHKEGLLLSHQQPLKNQTARATTPSAEHFITGFNQLVDPGTEVRAGKQEAIGEFTKSIQLNTGSITTHAYFARAYAHNQVHNYSQAMADYNRAIALSPKWARAYYNRGLLKQSKLKDPQGALLDYDKAIMLRSEYNKDSNNFGLLGKIYYNRGVLKYDELNNRAGGIADMKQAAKLTGSGPFYWSFLVEASTKMLQRWGVSQ
jgi:tetratricopeptide (TPR) repeat protein